MILKASSLSNQTSFVETRTACPYFLWSVKARLRAWPSRAIRGYHDQSRRARFGPGIEDSGWKKILTATVPTTQQSSRVARPEAAVAREMLIVKCALELLPPRRFLLDTSQELRVQICKEHTTFRSLLPLSQQTHTSSLGRNLVNGIATTSIQPRHTKEEDVVRSK